MTTPLIITPGKLYRTRDGRKARVYATDGGGSYRVHGAVFRIDGIWLLSTWTINGQSDTFTETKNDLIAEWIDAPVVPWKDYPSWYKGVVMSQSGNHWLAFDGASPTADERGWNFTNRVWDIPHDYLPIFNGDFRDSLVQRPQPEGGE